MTNNLSLLSIAAIAIVILSIVVLVVNNRVISAKHLRTQALLFGSLGFGLVTFMLHSPFFLVVSAFLFTCYFIKLCQYFHTSVKCLRHNEKVPFYRRP